MHFHISLIAPRSTQEMEGTICNCCTSGYASVVSSQECILAWPWKRCAGLRWTPMAAVYMLSCSSLNVYWSIDTICFSIYDIMDITCTYVYRYIYRSKMNVLSVHSWWLIEPPKLLDPILSIYVIACWSLFQWQLQDHRCPQAYINWHNNAQRERTQQRFDDVLTAVLAQPFLGETRIDQRWENPQSKAFGLCR